MTMQIAMVTAQASALTGTTEAAVPPGLPTARWTPAARTTAVSVSVAAAAAIVTSRFMRSKERNET
jgi:hypothetical protein